MNCIGLHEAYVRSARMIREIVPGSTVCSKKSQGQHHHKQYSGQTTALSTILAVSRAVQVTVKALFLILKGKQLFLVARHTKTKRKKRIKTHRS